MEEENDIYIQYINTIYLHTIECKTCVTGKRQNGFYMSIKREKGKERLRTYAFRIYPTVARINLVQPLLPLQKIF